MPSASFVVFRNVAAHSLSNCYEVIIMVEDSSLFWAFLTLSLGAYIVSIVSVRVQGPKAPLVGLKSIFEPRVLANYRFFKDSAAIINEGYARVSY